MAITHNLANVKDSLSGFDPVAGEVDGTTIGRSYLLWQIFQAFKAFDSTVVMVSSSGATPDWLKSESGSLMSAPAKSTSTVQHIIKWFYSNDVGLSGSTPNCFVYEWGTSQDVTSNNSAIGVGIRHVKSGSAAYYPFTSGSIVVNDNGSAGSIAPCMYQVNAAGSITTMNQIPKVIFWKSSNASAVMGISKVDASYQGYLIWHNPEFTGYRASYSASFTDGSDFRCVVFTNANNGATWEEGFSQNYETNLATYGSYLNPLGSGLMPSTQFVISGSLTLITSKLKFGVLQPAVFKAVSEPIEGIELYNILAYYSLAGTIVQANNKHYLVASYIPDGVNSQKVLLELGT